MVFRIEHYTLTGRRPTEPEIQTLNAGKLKPAKESVFIEMDFSGIEARVASWLNEEEEK